MESATTTITATLDEWEGTEVFDVEFARELKSHPDIPKEDRLRLSRYLKRCENVNHVKVSYKLGRKVRDLANVGRLVAEGGLGLQFFPRDQRSALAQRYYWDVDMVNAQPTLILQYCEREGLECGALKRYVECREEVLDEVMRQVGVERWEAKQRIVSLYFGGSSEGLTPFVVRDLAPEARRIVENVWKTNTETLKWIKKEPNHMGRGMSYFFQTEERKVLLAMARALAKRGRSLDVLIHDGGLVRKKEGETEFPSRILKEVEADIVADTGYAIRLAVKPMETTIERETGDDDYALKKRQFEETGWKGAVHFKLRHPPCFVALRDDSMEQLSRNDIQQNEQNNLLGDGSPFMKRWLIDADMMEFQKVGFYPKVEAPAGVFNVWRGFRNVPTKGADFSVFHEVLWLIANGDRAVFDYIENYFAHIIQKPYQRTNVSIVIQGEQGVGKDTFVNGVGYGVLGREYFYSTKTPENDVFAKFNSALARKLVIKFEEADFKTNKENASKLKGLITEEVVHIEKKNKDPIDLENYTNIVMTTNNDVPVVLEETDRRFMLVQASSAKLGDKVFWDRVHLGSANIHDPEVCSAYHHYLLSKDLTGFDPKQRPITQLYRDVKQAFTPYHARFFQRQLELEDDRTEPLEWSAHALFSAMKTGSPVGLNLSETRFGRDLRLYESVVVKTKTRSSNSYRADPVALRDFLTTKGWWVDY